MSRGFPGSGPGISVLEELWNKDKLKAETYPQLIRTLVRERNAFRESSKDSEESHRQQQSEIARLRQLVADLSNNVLMLERELRTLQSFIKQ